MRNYIEKNLIAKTGKSSSEWLPLYMHLKDTAGSMEYLINEFLSDSFANSCGLEKDVFHTAALFLAYVHDIGKATAYFQHKILMKLPERQSGLEELRLTENIFTKNISHAIAGEAILCYYGCPNSIAAVAGAHHGVPAEKGDIPVICDDLKDFNWESFWGHLSDREIYETVWKNIISDALEQAGISSVEELPELSCSAQMLMTGLLITSDWIASNTEFFPLLDVDDNGYTLSDYRCRINAALDKADFTERWDPYRLSYSNNDFKETFGFMPSRFQRAVLDIVKSTKEPGLFILEAPMGCGKTEAALSSAEILAAKCRKSGLFFGLPTQATANGIFPRILDWAENQSEDVYHTILLKHGSADLNEQFMKIQLGIPDVPDDDDSSGVIVHSWFCDRKKACLASFVTATVDQFLMSALKRRHVMLLHLGLSEKVVIIDEVHAYDAYMNRYLETALQWFGTYRTPVILLSATLPENRRLALVKAYTGKKEIPDEFKNKSLYPYPFLIWTDGDKILQKKLPYDGFHKEVLIKRAADEQIIDEIQRTVGNGGCAGIIVNTVKRAQNFAEQLRKQGVGKVILYHAQFTFPDRSDKEKKLIEAVGKNSTPEQRKGTVIVGTQVLEQSLDIDFDLLITDICPMDLLLQRIGRLHRHSRNKRPEAMKDPVCIVLTNEAEDKKSGSVNIYGEWLLNETLSALPEKIALPNDISPLVQKVYNASDDSKAYETFLEKQKIKESSAKAYLLNPPKRKNIHNLLERNVNDSNAEASVRDGISSVEVILLRKTNDGAIRMIGNEENISALPDESSARKIAGERLRLPSVFCQEWAADKTIRELEEKCKQYVRGWQECRLLKGKLALFLDENLEGELRGYKLKYSFENGLEYEKKEECE